MPVVRLAVAACVLLVLVACGRGRAVDAEAHGSLPTPERAAEGADYLARDGVTRSLGNDITLSVSAPTPFTPTDEAYPKAARSVAF